MDISQKAKAFDKALERAKKLKETCDNTTVVGWVEYIFPELAEEEKTRKDLLNFLLSPFMKENIADWKVAPWIAWIEKQKYTQRDVDDAYLKGVTDAKNELEKQGKQKPPVIDFKAKNWYVSKIDGKIYDMTYNPTDNIGPKFKVGDKVYNIKNGLECTIESIDEACYYCDMTNFDIKDQDGWKLVEQKPTWSEEDDAMLNQAIEEVEYALNDKYLVNAEHDDLLVWLKSLKQRFGGK